VERWAGVGHAQKALGIKQTGLCGIARMRLGSFRLQPDVGGA